MGTPILNATCNSHCACSSSYDPVCGSDGIMYFSACHAGCDVGTLENGDMVIRHFFFTVRNHVLLSVVLQIHLLKMLLLATQCPK